MSDDLRSLFESSIDTIPVPAASATEMMRRGRRLRNQRIGFGVASLLVVVGSIAVAVRSLETSAPPPVGGDVTTVSDVDKTAHRLIDDLKPLCSGYDFYFKAEVAGELYRPVQCGMQSDIALGPSRTPTPVGENVDVRVRLVKGPSFVLYAFADSEGRDAWLDTHAPPWDGRIVGTEWVVEVMDRTRFREVQKAMPEEEVERVYPPAANWRVGSHVVETLPDDYEPGVSLRSATRGFREAREALMEVLGAELGAYRNLDQSDVAVPAWIVTTRRCIPSYGGRHAAPDCGGDQLYIVIDAATGKKITSFTN
jgi:hypothetical protein